jgi:hypothetical protein
MRNSQPLLACALSLPKQKQHFLPFTEKVLRRTRLLERILADFEDQFR